jgi:hypothetical protein
MEREGGSSRGEDTLAVQRGQALEEGGRQRRARAHLRALAQLVHQHQRIRPRVLQHVPGAHKQKIPSPSRPQIEDKGTCKYFALFRISASQVLPR